MYIAIQCSPLQALDNRLYPYNIVSIKLLFLLNKRQKYFQKKMLSKTYIEKSYKDKDKIKVILAIEMSEVQRKDDIIFN